MAGPFKFGLKDLGTGQGVDWLNIGGQALKYIVPAARMLGNEKALKGLRRDSKLSTKPVSLYHGAVRDLARPNMAPRYRPAAGSSLSEFVSGQKFADASQRGMEAEFEVNNSASRLQQEQAIRNSKNQELLSNNQMENRTRQFNAGNAWQEKIMRQQNQEELQLGMTETALNDLNQKNYMDAASKASSAAEVLRRAAPGTPEYQQALQYYMGVIKQEKGGKIGRRTKFSNG